MRRDPQHDEHERGLVDAFVAGDLNALGQLVERHQSAVFAVAYSTTGDRVASEDLAQDAFVQAWRGRRRLSNPARFRAWVCGIARNLGRHENRARTRLELGATTSPEVADQRPDPLADAIASETQAMIAHALAQIPPRYRETLTLYYAEQCSASEVASALGISEAAVLQRLKRGREQLRGQVEQVVERGLKNLGPARALPALVVAQARLTSAAQVAAGGSTALRTIVRHLAGGVAMKLCLTAIAITLVAAVIWVLWSGAEPGVAPASGRTGEAGSSSSARGMPKGARQRLARFVRGRRATSSDRPGPGSQTPGGAAAGLSPERERSGTASDDPPEPGFAFALPGKNSEALWYRLHPALPDCAKKILGGRIDASKQAPASVSLRFERTADGRATRLVGVDLSGTSPKIAARFERCLIAAAGEVLFPVGPSVVQSTLWSEKPSRRPAADPEMVTDLNIKLGPARGPDNARVTLVVYTDFQCPYCAGLLPVLDQLLEDYPEEVRVVKKLFAIKASSRPLAAATVAAGEQGKFWQMHDLIFAHQDQPSLSEADLDRFASQLGLDLGQFRLDRASQTTADIVQRDIDEGQALGVRGTPTVFIGSERIVGARPIAVYRAKIDQALRR